MSISKVLIFIAVISSFSVSAAETIYERASNVVAKLEVLNNLGRECDYYLSIKGMEGAKSEKCTKFLKNIQGEYFKNIGKECGLLSEWYEQKRSFISSNADYADTNPAEATKLVRDMKAVNKSCHPSSLQSYEFLMKPLNKINALGELE